ncbi:conjugative transfer signal peptidase TraF [Lichenicoccus roseus]|nr:conjugative transfer signal peptidase TraF [Lichenicoccus roseus]
MIGRLLGYGVCLSLFGLVTAAQGWAWHANATYRLNMTPSMPVGLWAVSRRPPAQLTRGSIVAICLPMSIGIPARERGYVTGGECPGQTMPMLKTIAAVPGDIVAISTRGLSVNGVLLAHSQALGRDSKGRPLTGMAIGTYSVRQSVFWLYAGHDPRSFDSRYYGGLPGKNVIGYAWPLLVLQ